MTEKSEVKISGRFNLHIKNFPNDGKLWMVGWLGSVIYSYRYRDVAHPSVHVHLFCVNNEESAINDGFILHAEKGKTMTVLISVGQIMLIRIGDFWRDGRLIRAASGTRIEFKDVFVDEKSSKIVSAGSSYGIGNYLKYLSFFSFPFHSASTKSQCVALTLKNKQIVIIPCFELIRMYFGSSSSLLERLFENSGDWKRFYQWYKLRDNGHLSIKMSPGISLQSVEDVARIVGSKRASIAAQMVVRSCIAASASSADIYPKCHFPFEGITDLTVVGHNVYSEVIGTPPVFFVQFIEKCTHPFPFNSCWAISDDSIGAKFAKSHVGEPSVSNAGSSSKGDIGPAPSIVELDPSNNLAAINYAIGRDRYFPDLDRKKVRRSSGSRTFGGGSSPSGSTGAQPLVAVGEPYSTGNVRQIDIVIDQPAEIVPPDFLLKILKIIDKFRDCGYKFLAFDGDDGCTVPLSWLADADGVIDPRLLKEAESGRGIKVALIALSGVGDGYVLVVIETDMLPLIYKNSRDEFDDLEKLCRSIVADYLLISDLPHGSHAEFKNFSFDELSPEMSDWMSRLYASIKESRSVLI